MLFLKYKFLFSFYGQMENRAYMKNQVCVLAISALLAGCIQTVKPPTIELKKSYQKFLRGTVYIEGANYNLRLCGTGKVVGLLDPNQNLIPHIYLNNEIIPSVYLEFDARAANTLDWEVNKIYFSSKKAGNCSEEIETLDFLVSAVDQHWQAKIKNRNVALHKKNIYTQLSFVSDVSKSDQWKAKMVLPHGISYNLDLQLNEKPCIDDQDQWYSLSANLKLNGEKLKGCARTGASVENFNSGKFSNHLSPADAFIVLNLNTDNSATLILDYRNGHPMLVNNGHWKMLENQVIAVKLKALDDNLQDTLMLFQVYDSKELRLKSFSELLGKGGLKLLPIE